jgi:hypothetical protein
VIPLKGDHVFAPPYASRLSTFRAPGWGTPAILPPCRWRNATSRKLVPFSHRSASRIFIMQPGRIPSPAVTQDGDLSSMAGKSESGCDLGPALSFKDVHHPGWGGGRAEPELYLPRVRGSASPSAFKGEGAQRPSGRVGLRQRGAGRRRASSASARWARWLGTRCPLSPQGQLSRRMHQRTAQDVARCKGGVRVLGLSCLCPGTAPLHGDRCSAHPGGSKWGSAGG